MIVLQSDLGQTMQPIRKVQDAIWRHGWWIPKVTRALFRHTGLNFDRRHGADTETEIPVTALSSGNNAHERVGYVPIPVKHFAFAMGLVPRPLDCWSFLDIGSGKGRAVLLAIGYPFRRVTGVELAPELHAIAQDNLRRYRGPRRCREVEFICGDATTVPLPSGDVVIFLYNPFRGALMSHFLDHLEACLRATPRRLLLVYSNPMERAAVESRPAFATLFDGASPYDLIWWGVRRLAVYGAGFEDTMRVIRA